MSGESYGRSLKVSGDVVQMVGDERGRRTDGWR